MEKNQWRYIGDGVYAMWDGWHIYLRIGSHEAAHTEIALDPDVQVALARMMESIVEDRNG